MLSTGTRTWLLLAFVQFVFAAQYPAFAIAAETLDVAALNFWMFTLALLALGGYRLLRPSAPALRPAPAPGWPSIVALAGLGLVPAAVLLTWGIERSTAANASILSLTMPVMVVLIGMVLLRARPTPGYWAALAMTLLGTVMLSWSDVTAGRFDGATLLGNLLIVGSNAGNAFYIVYGKRLLTRIGEIDLLVRTYAVCVVLAAAASALFDARPFFDIAAVSGRSWLGVLVLGVGSWGLVMILWMRLIDRLNVAQVATSIYLVSVFGVLLSALALREAPSLVQLVGGALVVVPAYLTSSRSNGADGRDAGAKGLSRTAGAGQSQRREEPP